jgi:hypothetical protein
MITELDVLFMIALSIVLWQGLLLATMLRAWSSGKDILFFEMMTGTGLFSTIAGVVLVLIFKIAYAALMIVFEMFPVLNAVVLVGIIAGVVSVNRRLFRLLFTRGQEVHLP